MKWFTREWAYGGWPEEQMESHRRAYASHLNAIGPHLCNGAEELIASVYLHDAQILSAETEGARFQLRVIAGDLQRGYERLGLTYDDALIEGGVGEPAARADVSEVVYDEVDLAPDGRFEHRLLLYPEGELRIRFRSLQVQCQPASPADRR